MRPPPSSPDRSARWEFVLLVTVLIALVWQYQGLRDSAADAPDEDRYRQDETLQAGPLIGHGKAAVASLCHGVTLPPRLQWRWAAACNDTKPEQAVSLDALPAALRDDYAALQRAIAVGVIQRQAGVAPLAKSLAEGVLPENDQARLAATTRELTAYRSRYQLDADPAAGSLTLACAWAETSALALRAGSEAARTAVLANQMALIRGAGARLWWPVPDPAMEWSRGAAAECGALGTPQRVISQATDLVRQVREGEKLANKSIAMQRLLHRAPWLLVGWSLLAWGLLSLARRTRRPLRFLPPALLAWSLMGAISGLVQPDTGARIPWWLWAAMAALGVGIAVFGRIAPAARLERVALFAPSPLQNSVSFLSLPMFVLFVGIGWWLTIDLALNGHFQNRYIPLRHGLAVFAAMFLLSVLPVFAHGLATSWVTWASLVTNALRPGRGTLLGGWLRPAILWASYAFVVLGFAVLTPGWRQFTGELLPLLLLLGVSWFFLLRAGRWTLSQGTGWSWLGSSLLPLLVHVVVLLVALAVTDDLGPMLVVLLASAIFIGAFSAQALLARGAPWPSAAGIGIVTAAVFAGVLVSSLYVFSKLPITVAERVAERVDSVLNPYSAENDQLAHVLWLGQHTPATGYGFGAVPWCGSLPASACPGIPAQAQSDYTFAALRAVMGTPAGFGVLAAYLLWLGWQATRQAATRTRGTLALATPGASQAAWLSWLGVCWAVLTIVQTLVTVAGNLGALPLTGVTWPFVSYGLWSLLRNTLILGMVMHRPAGPE